jgi:ribonuclease P protein component
VLRTGKLIRAPRLSLYSLPNDLACARLALIVPKRLVPLAVARNRIRRLIRETFRLHQRLVGARDCVVRLVRSPGNEPISRAEVENLLSRIL